MPSMTMLDATALPRLPKEVKALIVDGVYSLYELGAPADVRYLLYTQDRAAYYLLADDGSVVTSGDGLAPGAAILRAISFTGSGTGVRINYSRALA